MELHYVKIDKDWDELDIEDSVIFELPTGTIEYEIREGEGWYLRNHNGYNSEIFSKLEKNGESYVKSIVGYDCTGFFPEVKSIYDLKKVIKALDDEFVKKFGMPKEEFIHPSKLKDGDFIKIERSIYSYILIFEKYKNNAIYRYATFDLEDKCLCTNSSGKWGDFSNSDKITYATEEEKKLLLDKLAEEGYVWDNVNKKLLEVSSLNITDKIGVVEIPQEHYLSDCISRVNPIYIPSYYKYSVFVDTDKEEAKEELNLFPIKKHYQLNFNY